ncbi:hypothetical protein [Methylobacter luteus]|uniref:hypothetical protein n=1 Tax=Methylobacter luteus TaxID=415 RepID=UPI00041080DA|nr:hypothetical protein [Methylobacter luteus]
MDSITTETIEKIAAYFKIEPYRLLIPNMPIEELLDNKIEQIIKCYTKSVEEGRENIKRIAEMEARYNLSSG